MAGARESSEPRGGAVAGLLQTVDLGFTFNANLLLLCLWLYLFSISKFRCWPFWALVFVVLFVFSELNKKYVLET